MDKRHYIFPKTLVYLFDAAKERMKQQTIDHEQDVINENDETQNQVMRWMILLKNN